MEFKNLQATLAEKALMSAFSDEVQNVRCSRIVKEMDGSLTVSFKIQPKEIDQASKNMASKALEMLGLPGDLIGREVAIQGRSLIVNGVNLNRPKNPIGLACKKTGKQFKCGELVIKRALMIS